MVILFGGTIINKIKVLIPGYNMTKPPIEDIEIIKYDITNDKVQWYDGVKFYDFGPKGDAKVGKKNLDHGTLRKEFGNDWYYKSDYRGDKWTKLSNGTNRLIYSQKDIEKFASQTYKTPPELDLFIISVQLPKGELYSVLRNQNRQESKVYGEFVLGLDDNLYFRKIKYDFSGLEDKSVSIQKDSEVYKEVSAFLVNWRYSILEKPVLLTYQEDGKEKETKSYCVILYKPDKLKVDLAKPVDANYKCPIEVK